MTRMTASEFMVDATILRDVRSYFKFRKYVEPTSTQALLWMISEMGELCQLITEDMELTPEALVLGKMMELGVEAENVLTGGDRPWVRNNPIEPKREDVAREAGDVLMMFYKFAEKAHILPYFSMTEKFKEKKWVTDWIYACQEEPNVK
jgi:NTP pyrophosphatase (non-canonical NTP hydrolase)